MGKNMKKIISLACFVEFFISNFASAVFAIWIYSIVHFLEIIILWIAKKVEKISSTSYLFSLFRKITEVFEDEDVESLDEEMKAKDKKKDKKRKGERVEDLQGASIEKRRRTLKSEQSNVLKNGDTKKPGKEESDKEKPEKKDKKRKEELLEKLCDAPLEKTRKILKSEAQSRRRKWEDMDLANKDSRTAESNNGRVEPSIVSTKQRGKRNKDEEITDMVSQKQRFDDQDKLHRSIFVSNLPLKTRKKRLIKEFSHFGEVEFVKLQAVLIAEINEAIKSCQACIIFKNEQFASAALSCNITELGGKPIRVVRAQTPSKKLRCSLL